MMKIKPVTGQRARKLHNRVGKKRTDETFVRRGTLPENFSVRNFHTNFGWTHKHLARVWSIFEFSRPGNNWFLRAS